MKIDRIEKVWKDLEYSYSKMGKGLNRSDFIKKCIGYKLDGSHNISHLLESIGESMNEMDDSRLESYTILSTIFKDLANYVDVNGIPDEIEDLQEFIINILNNKSNEVSLSDFNSMFSKSDCNSISYPYSKMISNFRCVESYVHFVKDNESGKGYTPRAYKGYEIKSDNFKVIKHYEVTEFIRVNFNNSDNFVLDCALILILLNKLGIESNSTCITSIDNIQSSTLFGQDVVLVNEIKAGNIIINQYKLGEILVYARC